MSTSVNPADFPIVIEVDGGIQGPQGPAGSDADVTGHEAAADPHPQYVTHAEADTAYEPAGTTAGGVATHEGATDPHPQYLTDARGDGRYDALGAAAAAVSAAATYTDTQVANLVATAPEALDTLNELASALGNDPNFATTVSTELGTKAGKGQPNTFTRGQNIVSTDAAEVTLTVQGAPGQSANVVELRAGDGTSRLLVSDAGYVSVTGNVQTGGGLRVGTGVTYTTNQNWVAVQNAASAPGSVSNGAIVYAEGGTLKVRTATRTVDLSSTVDTGDSRLSDARTPTAHAASHAAGGADEVTPSAIGAVSVAAGLVVVEHGADGTVARPAGAAAVYWIGSVEPANGVDHDLWYNTGA